MPKATSLPDGHKLYVSPSKGAKKQIQFAIKNYRNGDLFGHIIVKQLDNNYFFVNAVNAPRGYGPYLYDCAMKYLSERGFYMMSNIDAHRKYRVYGGTSSDASAVWDYYRSKRPDVSENNQSGFYMKEFWKAFDKSGVMSYDIINETK